MHDLGPASRSVGWSGVSDHCPGPSVLLDRDEAGRLVEATRWIVLGDAETHGSVSLSNAGLDEVDEEPSSDPLVSTGGDDCDRQFGHILSDEAIAMVALCIRPIPSRPHPSFLFGNQSIVALPWPSIQVQRVPRIGHHLRSGRCRLVRPPDCGLTEHRREKGEVLSSGRSTPNLVHPLSSKAVVGHQPVSTLCRAALESCRDLARAVGLCEPTTRWL